MFKELLPIALPLLPFFDLKLSFNSLYFSLKSSLVLLFWLLKSLKLSLRYIVVWFLGVSDTLLKKKSHLLVKGESLVLFLARFKL